MTGDYIINRVWDALDQTPLKSEDPETDAQLIENPSTNFGKEALLKMISNGQREIVARCKAMHVRGAVETLDETTETLPFLSRPVNRVLRSMQFRKNADGVKVRTIFRNLDAARRLESRGRAGTEDRPIHSWEDGALDMYPQPTHGFEVNIVGVPDEVTDPTLHLVLDERFEAALVAYVLSTCYQALRQPGLAQMNREEFEDELDGYAIYNRYTAVNDREIDVE